jgi:outer membrane biosynthesis protein TonB
VLGVVFPWIPLPVPEGWEVIEVPERLTRLIEERVAPPPPVNELLPEQREPKPVEEEQLLAEEATPEPASTKEKPKPGAGSKGILAFREKFSNLADSAASAKLGSRARITRSGELASGRTTRSLVTTNGPGSSGGIDLAALSRDVGGGGGQGIEGVQVARATSAIGAIGGGTDRPLSGGPGSSRTDEEIQIVFDRNKAALYRLYNRELRRIPTLQGQIVLRMTIEPDGSVSLCEVHSSDMKAPALATQVVERVKAFDFGAKDGIPAITILYPIDFLPAA